jgi:tRNA A-37 threonylcarbamoyl transferase component Bud32
VTAEQALAFVRTGAAGPAEGPPSSEALGLQVHLDECARCRMVVAEAARQVTGEDAVAGAPFRTLGDGERLLNRYEIRRFIARGGMGEVYEAFDVVMQDTVALKTLLPTALDDEHAVERLLAEVRLARKVTHPNVCRILEFGVHRHTGRAGAAVPFLTMELLRGEALARRIASHGAMAPATVRRLLADVTAGLQAIHAAGIVHRDFKSENVFLVGAGEGQERAVLMDFGLARGLRGDLMRLSSAAAVGTPDYMAPEQVEGKPATAAFDIYALGVVLYEMLTGRKPFTGASPYLAALSRLRERAPAPSQLVPGLPQAWDAVVGRCLERQPERRFARVEEIASTLEALLGGKRKPLRPWLLAAAGAGAVGLLAMVPGGLRLMRGAGSAATTAPSERGAAERVASAGLARADSLAVPPAPAAPSSTPAGPVASTRAAPVSRRPPRSHARTADHAARRPEPAPAPDVLESALTLLQDAHQRMLEGSVAQACALGERAAVEMPAAAEAQLFLGKCYIRLGKPELARGHYRKYLELAPDAADRIFVRGILEGAP